MPARLTTRFVQMPFWEFALFAAAWVLLIPRMFLVVDAAMTFVFDPELGGVYDDLIVGVSLAVVAWFSVAAIRRVLGYGPGDRSAGRGPADSESRSAGTKSARQMRNLLGFVARFVRGLICGAILLYCIWAGLSSTVHWLAP